MKLKNKILAGLAGAALVLSAGLVAAPAASAVYGNKVINQTNGCITLRADGGHNFNICGYGSYAFHNSHVVIPRGTCLFIGQWSYRYICASGKVNYLYPIGSGTWYVRK